VSFAYSLHGLLVASDLLLPELAEAAEDGEPDVVIRHGPVDVAEWIDGEMNPVPGGAGFRIGGVASYAVLGGREITVAPVAGAPAANVRLYLLGSASGMLLHQRGILPLHANAVEVDGQAFAFLGKPGAGKSTLAAAMEQAGQAIIADDVCAVRFDDVGTAWLHPGLPRLRLWRASLDVLGLDVAGLPRSYAGDEQYDKYDVSLRRPVAKPVLLAALLLLRGGDELGFRSLAGTAAVTDLIENIYRGSWAGLAGSLETHWRSCMRLAATLPVIEVTRPRDLGQLEETTGKLLDFCRSLTPGNVVARDTCAL
jgi:hypothetical protein